MKKTYCDLCGKEIDPWKSFEIAIKRNVIEPPLWKYFDYEGEVCKTCAKSIKEQIRKLRSSERRNGDDIMKKKIEGIEKSGFLFGYNQGLKDLEKWIEEKYIGLHSVPELGGVKSIAWSDRTAKEIHTKIKELKIKPGIKKIVRSSLSNTKQTRKKE